jgi:hypothetical protein
LVGVFITDRRKKATKILRSIDKKMKIAGISYEELVNETSRLIKVYRKQKSLEGLTPEEDMLVKNALVELDNGLGVKSKDILSETPPDAEPLSKEEKRQLEAPGEYVTLEEIRRKLK